MTAHARSLGVARAWADCAGLTARDRYLVVNPFFHSFGFKAGMLACLVSGAALVPQPVFDAGRGHAAGRGRADHRAARGADDLPDDPGPPRARPPATCPACGSRSPARPTCRSRWSSGCARELSFETVLTAYGLTEAVVATMCRPGDAAETVARTSGRAAAGFEVRIRPDGGGRTGDPARSCSAGRT